jgi:transposase
MMGIKEREFRRLPDDLSLEVLVPTDNFYRRLEERIDLSFVRGLVSPLYAGGGRPSVDPVVFFKLQLVMFFEDLRSERQLMRVVADRLSLRWYVGYDLQEPLLDHSSLTRIRERFGLTVFRRFFERVVEMCAEAGLVWGKEMFFDATKVGANAAVGSLAPRWAVEAHMDDLFDGGEVSDGGEPEGTTRPTEALPSADDEGLAAANFAAGSDWVSRGGEQDRSVRSGSYRRVADTRASKTDPDATPTRYGGGKLGLGYHAHYVVDGGRSRVILNALVTPSEVMEQQPMLDLLWRTAFRFRLRPRRVTGDSAYGTRANISAIERAGVRAYVNLKERENPDKRFFPPSAFAYDAERDLFRCPAGQELLPWNSGDARDGRRYKAKAKIRAACSLKPGCTPNKRGRTVFRHFDEGYVDRVRAYRETEPYRKALRKRKVWVEPLFAEAKDWHGLRRFRLRRLERVNQEALMIAAGQNVKRLLGFGGRSPRRLAQAAALRQLGSPSSRLDRRHRLA